MSQATAAGARMCLGTFFVQIANKLYNQNSTCYNNEKATDFGLDRTKEVHYVD